VVSFRHRRLYRRRKHTRYPFDRRKILPLPGLEFWTLGRPARNQSLS
jgi:hypothetical protein